MSETPTIITERVDDVPLLLAQCQRMGLPTILDAHLPVHGARQGLSIGWMLTVWLAHILSQADHRLNRVRPWADALTTTLNAILPTPIRPTDFTDDRLADGLRLLADPTAWAAIEAALGAHLLRVYALHPQTVRVDSTTVSGSWPITEDGLFQDGHSKDHRPDLPQFKMMLATLDPLGLPLATDVVGGQRSDIPLYLPIIERVRTILNRTGLLYVGDGKLGSLANRAAIQAAGDSYLCPLDGVQLPFAALATLVDDLLTTDTPLIPIRLPSDPSGPVVAVGVAQTVVLTAPDDPARTWNERRLLIRSQALQAAQIRALHDQLTTVESDLADLLVARRGKTRPTTPEALATAIHTILTDADVADLLTVTTTATAAERTVRGYHGRPAHTETTYTMTIQVSQNAAAIADREARLGWRVYATNHPTETLSLPQVVATYREAFQIEHGFSRLKGAPLSLRPVYLSRADHTTGLTHLLTLGLRVLTLLEGTIRQQLAQEATPSPIAGLYAGQPNRTTMRPTTEQVLTAFRQITLTIVQWPGQIIRHLPPLSPLQARLLALAQLDPTCYTQVTADPPVVRPMPDSAQEAIMPS